jgi:hypothetical protein
MSLPAFLEARIARSLISAFAFRFVGFAAMVWMALLAEGRSAPHLPDAVLIHLPYVSWVDRYNYWIWLAAYIPVALVLLWKNAALFCRYMVTSGILTVVRGVCILSTGLGPVRGGDINAGMDAATRWKAFLELTSPFGVFERGSAHLYMTKDLFFSGHTSTTLVLLLYVWRYPRLRWWMLMGHLLVVASVFFAHLHYTIDVIGAYAVAFSLFVLREAKLSEILGPNSVQVSSPK